MTEVLPQQKSIADTTP